MTSWSWDKRIARAEELAHTQISAAEILKFYIAIARFQKNVASELKAANKSSVDTTILIPHFMPLLSLVRRHGPAPLSEAAADLARDENTFQELLVTAWDSDSGESPSSAAPEERYSFFARALLQPYAEYLASRSDIALGVARSTCPFCGEKPVAGVLRGEGEGAKRSLLCSLCSTEWEFRRIVCAGCGEEGVDKLPVYRASQFDYVRVEACDTCQTYIKSVDLTRNGLAVPVVDELATIALNVWAEEKGYAKLQPNLLEM